MSALVAGSADSRTGWDLVEIVGSTALVIWVAHVYAHGIGESIGRNQSLHGPDLAAIARGELPILLAAVAPSLALALGATGVLGESRAISLALGLGLLTLYVEGIRYARIERVGTPGTVVVVALNLALGCLVIGLKVFVDVKTRPRA